MASWLTSFADVSDPACELVCFPHAGGGSSVFQTWHQHTDALRVSAIRLPGRESRLREPAIADLGELVEALATALVRLPEKPYAFYGHSMGALVAFELTRKFRALGLPLPRGLFVAGMDAPQQLDLDRAHDLPRDELVAWLIGVNGLSPEVLEYPALIDLMLPTIRADLAVVEDYDFQQQPPLPVPIHVLRGRADVQVTVEGCDGWSALTDAGCRVTDFDGDHFFVEQREKDIVRLIEADLIAERAQR
ncbi:alpha/beta fold hydrolase [Lentzea sp. NBRC 105346]|uniref:thioesterase II family protein n=1 Tax=Lentzea sp. NBRC 105346 TaxID=3032205 RepID=UPI002553B408|nr:alpha/beta fold hydrolase [Lentzea sp. NBRC 105346]